MRFFSLLAIIFTFGYISACDYTVDLHDTFGDGWNGNSITISVNGTPVLTDITVGTGSDASFNFTANSGDVILISYDDGGNWQSENEITITSDDLATVIYTDGMGGTTPLGGTFTLGANCGLAAPANDDPCGAINLPMNGTCNPLSASVDGATTTALPDPSCGSFTTQGDVWFETTVGASGLLQIDLSDGGIDANMAIYDGVDCDNLNEIGCSVSNTFYSDVIPAGTQLWIRVWDENNSVGSFTICAVEPPPPPINNDPCTAEMLTVSTVCNNTTGTTESAINSAIPNPTCSFGYNGGDVWYTATVPASGFMHVNLTAGGLQDGGIAVYSGPDCNTLSEVLCDESTWDMPNPVVVTPANALEGQQVWIRIWEGDNDNPGSFEICLVDEPVFWVDTTMYSPEVLVEDILVTGCLQAFNVQYTGSPRAIGYFGAENTNYDFSSGIILTSGDAILAASENNVGSAGASNEDWATPLTDPDLEALSGVDIHDAAVLEFDFIPSSDTIRFKYIFASEEYDEYVCGTVNDAFGFFISGPGIAGAYTNGAENIALIPNTNIPVSINTVNNGSIGANGDASNCDGGSNYYLGNSVFFQSNPFASHIQYDGFTVEMEAVAVLQACETYHIQLKIGDGGDASFDSAVMFEASSFSSGGDVAQNNFSNVGADNDIYEGCENYYIFSRIDTSAIAMQDTVDIILNIGGTAIEGVDYSEIPDTLYILPGETEYTLYYSAIFDDLDEGTEYIVFSLLNGCPCSLTSVDDTIWIKNNYHLNATITDPELICYGDSSEIGVLINPNIDPLLVTYTWSTTDTVPNFWDTPSVTTDYIVTITNVCESDEILNTSVTVVPTINPNFVISKDTACIGEPVSIGFIGSATNLAQYDWTFTDADPSGSSFIGPNTVTWASTGDKIIDLHINDQGCLNDTSFQINIREYNNMSLVPTASDINCFSVCDGFGSVTANSGVAPYTYLWTDGQTSQTAVGLCPGTFDVTVSDAYGCKDTTHITVTSVSALTYTFSTEPASCYGLSDGTATVVALGGTTPYSYVWSDENTDASNINIPANRYSVTITDANGCEEIEDNIEVLQPSQVITTIYGESYNNSELWICMGQTETIHTSATGGVGPYTFEWNTGLIADQIVVNPQETISYTAQATDVNGCVSPVQNITLNVYSPINIETVATPTEICKGELVNVGVVANGGNGEYNYSLESNSGIEVVSDAFILSPEQTQDFVITVSDNCGSPTANSSFNVLVHNAPVISFNANKLSGCEPLQVQFLNNSEEENQDYLWEFISHGNEGDISFEKSPTHTFNYNGTFDVRLTVTSENNCKSELIKHAYITVFPMPTAEFIAKPSVVSLINPNIYFSNKSIGADYYQWSFGDSDSSHQVNPEHRYAKRMADYSTELIAISRFGCSDTISQKVRVVDEITFYVPSAFSPDGDGKNEIFSVKGNGIVKDGFNMIIYDRWGMEIYNTTDIFKGWDGKTSNGYYVSPGVYSWVIKYTDVYMVPHQKGGVINVIR